MTNTQRQVEEDREKLHKHVHGGGKEELRIKHTCDATAAIKLIQFGLAADALENQIDTSAVCRIPHE